MGDHVCGNGRTSADCPECIEEDRLAHEAARRLQLEFEVARNLGAECEICATINWPSFIWDTDQPDWSQATFHCRRCGAGYDFYFSSAYAGIKREATVLPFKRQPIPRMLVRQVMERDAFRCQQSGCGTWIDLTIDHIVPVSRGGETVLMNLQTLCRSHNSSKGARV